MPTLARGPAIAMASSSAGAPGSPEISETPPMGKSTMSRTEKPRRRATKLWDSSWTTMQMKRAAIQMQPFDERARGRLAAGRQDHQYHEQRETPVDAYRDAPDAPDSK